MSACHIKNLISVKIFKCVIILFSDWIRSCSVSRRLPTRFSVLRQPTRRSRPQSFDRVRRRDRSGDHLARDDVTKVQNRFPGRSRPQSGTNQEKDLLLGNRKRMFLITGTAQF
jgi:hypothetical protein